MGPRRSSCALSLTFHQTGCRTQHQGMWPQTKILSLFGTESHFASDCVWDTEIQFVKKTLNLFLVFALILGGSLELHKLFC